MKLRIGCMVVGFLSLVLSLVQLTVAQTPTQTASALPRLVRFGGTVKDLNGNPLAGVVGITFSLYSEQSGGAALWLETQNVTADGNGHYTVLLGSTKPDGLPGELFTSEQARWVGVQVSGQTEQPRMLLVSAPYALKAGDAETIGGLPPSAFMLAAPLASGPAPARTSAVAKAGSASPAAATDVTTTGGKVNYLPVFNGPSTIVDSVVYQSGTKVGINTITPSATLDVNGNLFLPNTNSGGTLGVISIGVPFLHNYGPSASWNVFLGAHSGNFTTTGANDVGTGYETLTHNTTGFENTADGSQALYNNTTGNANTASGFGALFTNTTSSYNTATGAYALQSSTSGLGANTATGYQALQDNVLGYANTATGAYALRLNTAGTHNTATGFVALGVNTSGSANTASGWTALGNNTTGGNNTASGFESLVNNSIGTNNTAAGASALFANTTGASNTAVGSGSGSTVNSSGITANNNTFLGANTVVSTGTISNATAVGSSAEVTASNALVLGSINGVNGATASTYVGIGTTAPSAKLNVSGAESTTNGRGATIEISNSASGGGNFYLRTGATGTATPTDGFSIGNDNLYILSMNSGGQIGIDTNTITNVLTISKGKGQAIADGWSTYSSRRWKTNIQPLQGALGKVSRMRGVSYDLKDSGRHEIGVIAEEVGAVVPEVVSYEENGKDARGVDYSRLTALLIEATKEQQREIRHEHAELAKALRQIKQQQSLLRAQSAAMRSLQAEVHESGETLRKVKAQVAAAQPTLVAGK